MKIENPFGARFNRAAFSQIDDVFESPPQLPFSEVVSSIRLDPIRHLRYANLCGVDFSNSDLRLFDFTGADLRGSFGINISFDQTTIFAEADVANSIFAYWVDKTHYFARHPDDEDRVRILASDYWANTLINISDLISTETDIAKSVRIARAVFEDTSDPMVRSNILLFLGAKSDAEENKAFVLHLLATRTGDKAIVGPAVNTLCAYYRNDPDVFKTLMRLLSYPIESIQLAALGGVLKSQHLRTSFDDVKMIVTESRNPMMRREFLRRIANHEFKNCAVLLEDDLVRNVIDFSSPISGEKMVEMARRAKFTNFGDDFKRLRDNLLIARHLDLDIEKAQVLQKMLFSLSKKYGIAIDFFRGEITERHKNRFKAHFQG